MRELLEIMEELSREHLREGMRQFPALAGLLDPPPAPYVEVARLRTSRPHLHVVVRE